MGSPEGKYETLQLSLLCLNLSLCLGQQKYLKGMDKLGRLFKRETKMSSPEKEGVRLNANCESIPRVCHVPWENTFLHHSLKQI